MFNSLFFDDARQITKGKLRSDQSSSLESAETASQVSDENLNLTGRDFSDISNKIENRLSKRLRDTEFGQREILRMIENLASKVDNLSNPSPGMSNLVQNTEVDPPTNTITSENDRNVSSNKTHFQKHVKRLRLVKTKLVICI